MSSPLYGVAAMNAIGFGVYGNVLRRLDNPDSVFSITVAGITSGFVGVSDSHGSNYERHIFIFRHIIPNL